MSAEKSILMQNAIKENTRYLTGSDTYKVYDFMIKNELINDDKIYYKELEETDKKKLDYKKTIVENFDNGRDALIEYFEDHEFVKHYKYGVVREIDINFNNLAHKFSKLLKNGDISIDPTEYSKEFEYPEISMIEKSYCLKFSYAIGTRRDKADWFAFPVLATFYPEKNIVIVSFDSFPYVYHTKSEMYQDIVSKIIRWIESKIGIKTKQIKLLDMVKDIINIKSKDKKQFMEVKEYVRDGYDRRGGRVKITADDNDEMSFLDQLSKIAESLSTEDDRNKLRNFIHVFSNDMKFVERGFTWIVYNRRKTKMTMTVRENFISSEMELIHFYENNWGRERDIYGIDYIINYKSQIE